MLQLRHLFQFFATGADRPPPAGESPATLRRRYEWHRWSVFLSVTFGYACFYVCRTNFSIVKKPMLEAQILDATQMGLVESALLWTYAFSKLFHGFLADRCNIRRFLATGLLVSALLNLVLGSSSWFSVFLLLWGLNGFFQATGSAPSVVSLSQWFTRRELGTRYGLWSLSHSLGEGFTFFVISWLVTRLGWAWGFWGPGLLGVGVAALLYRTLADRPQTLGLPPVEQYRAAAGSLTPTREAAASSGAATSGAELAVAPAAQAEATVTQPSVGRLQLREVIGNPAVWLLGLASATMYVARYGMNGWGVLFLQTDRGYGPIEAGAMMSVYPVAGAIGSASSGWISDRFFRSGRNLPVLLFGLLDVAALLALYLVPPGWPWVDAAALAAFGFGLGGMLVFLGGLMAVDLCSPRVAGAAMGAIGVFSYLGAGLQSILSGWLLDQDRTVAADGLVTYHFDRVLPSWIAASLASVLLTLLIWWWTARRRRRNEERGTRGEA